MVRIKIPDDIEIDDWHYRMICKLCGFHNPINREPTKHDFEIELCLTCHQHYTEEWEYGIYKLVECSKWYNPFRSFKWVNKILEEENESNKNTKKAAGIT